jgi:hypothetical protein
MPSHGDQMLPGDYLSPGNVLTSENQTYSFTLQADSNICLYQSTTGLWCAMTEGKGITKLIMQADGNLVGYDSGGHVQWASHTSGNSGAWLTVSDEGEVVIGKVIWKKP